MATQSYFLPSTSLQLSLRSICFYRKVLGWRWRRISLSMAWSDFNKMPKRPDSIRQNWSQDAKLNGTILLMYISCSLEVSGGVGLGYGERFPLITITAMLISFHSHHSFRQPTSTDIRTKVKAKVFHSVKVFRHSGRRELLVHKKKQNQFLQQVSLSFA